MSWRGSPQHRYIIASGLAYITVLLFGPRFYFHPFFHFHHLPFSAGAWPWEAHRDGRFQVRSKHLESY